MEIDMRYDDVFMQMLQEKKSIVGFLETIFNFLARRTDFYYESKRDGENLGFPPGVKEKIVQKVIQSCDPKRQITTNQHPQTKTTTAKTNSEIAEDEQVDAGLVPAPANEICIEAEAQESVLQNTSSCVKNSHDAKRESNVSFQFTEYYNGATYDSYCWSQSITDIELHILLPLHISSAKQLNVSIAAERICVKDKSNLKDSIFEGQLAMKCRSSEAVWSISNRKLQITLDKVQEVWWSKLLDTEPALDLSKMDCSRPFEDLPEDSQAAIAKLRWDQQQKALGLPTSEDLKNEELLKQAWNAEGSPFKGQPFDPSIVKFN